MDLLTQKTINDFGEQWTNYTDNEGWYGSKELLEDIIEPLIQSKELANKSVAEIGSGTGRIIKMLSELNVSRLVAIEPSASYSVLQRNVEDIKCVPSEIELIHETGDKFIINPPVDYIFSIGVLHHIPDPVSVINNSLKSLKSEGRIFIWLYGYENNELYVNSVSILRAITTRVPHSLLKLIVTIVYGMLTTYQFLARYVNLPLRDYLTNVLWKMSPEKRRLVIYDQLNPSYSKYYRRNEALELLSSCGLKDIKIHHRHGYSWSVIGTKP